ncbi:DUF2142 domain-containing protein [Mucilaginibacter celer]|uniref:DUF2142 domain-containing protein n=1 Tax=Mucilaginibacter celer TaxID=2305508 RepID=A0A494VK94_9SPHI|nr:DUF2142 domain-containing protein [Mucilaginibacter celer]AYL95556.1 DUF2142 domain-containing protein [Mucilaginibacter celer]
MNIRLNKYLPALNSFSGILYNLLPIAYLVYAIILVCIATFMTPPFQNPDEPNHFARAEQVSRFEWIPTFVHENNKAGLTEAERLFGPDKGGFKTDGGIYHVDSLVQTPPKTLNKTTLANADNVKWGESAIYYNFGNTAIYPPVVYFMPALGIAIGKLFNMSVITTLYISRLLNATLSVAITFIALLLARRSRILLFVVLLFPMTAAMFASVSQDAILISCSFLIVAIVDHIEFDTTNGYQKWQLYTLITLLAVVAVGKPPYLLFAAIVLFTKFSRKQKIAGICIPFAVLISWLVINHANFGVRFASPELRVNAHLQFLGIIHRPLNFISMFFKYDKMALINFAHMFVGVLGPLTLVFSDIYYRNAYIVLCVGMLAATGFKKNDKYVLRFVLISIVILTTIAILTAQYITWTALNSETLSGMQGRYLLPVYPFLALALSGFNANNKLNWLKTPLLIAVIIFPVYTAITMVQGLTSKYYQDTTITRAHHPITTSQKNQHLCIL